MVKSKLCVKRDQLPVGINTALVSLRLSGPGIHFLEILFYFLAGKGGGGNCYVSVFQNKL